MFRLVSLSRSRSWVRSAVPSAALALALAAVVTGCPEDEGVVDKAGRKIDETIDKLRHGDEGPLEKTGRKIDEAIEEAVDDAKEKLWGED